MTQYREMIAQDAMMQSTFTKGRLSHKLYGLLAFLRIVSGALAGIIRACLA